MDIQSEIKPLSFYEDLFLSFKSDLLDEMNIKEQLSDEELKNQLTYIIKQYEMEFKDSYTDLFLYNYYQNLLHNHTIDKILDYIKFRKGLTNNGRDKILISAKNDSNDAIYLYGLSFAESTEQGDIYTSSITGLQYLLKPQVTEIINNRDIFLRPPKGTPNLRGPHTTYTLEYGIIYWQNFKQHIVEYIDDFDHNHSDDFLEDLTDYRYWLNVYRIYTDFTNQIQITKERQLKQGGNHVKN